MGRAFEFRKGRKLKRWAHMAKTFTRLGKDIVIAIKEGGSSDPDSNSRLRAVLQNCKAENMPKENIERAIKRATDKDTSSYDEKLFEGYAPHGIAVLVETATDNNNRTVANVRSYFNKCNGSLGTSGSVEFMFEHKCHFKIAKGELDVEELELELIDFGAEEVFIEEAEKEEEGDKIMIYGEFKSFGSLQKALEDMGIEIISSGLERIPTTTKKLTAEQEEEVDKLIEKLEEDDDVQHVYHTME
ncbi:YebC/PmpR family DNA-binding transcriptional regulator [Flammeovirga aprica]|uniref:Probable transcriptional regulatory protein HHU12_25710 n=1 Tax=Flammeovirga aprica JL-4 TaxID=694437 RepID=A0A7X9RZ17_9BACT|nr:YebC/PmpR family DNA-binding transcriptional regulator [Flammeovirga aprica]NME71388.1 YebC/PmpR family DNA-binding transcriptional regulator [Flammeovirga aprica JL-4]